MKKLFFTFWVLITVTLFSVSLVSCGSDDDNTVLPKKSSYMFEYTLSNDFLQLFDVKTVITVGNTTTELKYDKAVTTSHMNSEFSCMTTGNQTFEVEQGTTVSSKTTYTIKSNWKETIASMDSVVTYCKYSISASGILTSQKRMNVFDDNLQTDGFGEMLNHWAEYLDDFNYSSK